MPYFGVIQEFWELDYDDFKVSVFKCNWVNENMGVHQNKMRLTLVDLEKVGYKDEPFIMAALAKQMFYIQDPSDLRWSVVLQGETSGIPYYIDASTLDVNELPTFSPQMPSINAENEEDDVHANRNDHHEGFWENTPM